MILRRRTALVALLLAPLAARGQARGAPNVLDLRIDYRADSRIGDGAKPVAGRLWRTRRALRHESREGGKPQILVLRLDRRLGWLALPELGMTIETGLDELDLPVGILDGGAGLTQTRQAFCITRGCSITFRKVKPSCCAQLVTNIGLS